MKKAAKYLSRLLLTTAVVCLFLMCVNVLSNGMWLLGLPNEKDIESVSVSYPSVTEEVKLYSDSENIHLALSLSGFLKYTPLKQPDQEDAPLITITYHLKDATRKTLSASDRTVWWNGTARCVKQTGAFIKLTGGIFFLSELQT